MERKRARERERGRGGEREAGKTERLNNMNGHFLNRTRARALMAIISFNLNSRWHFALELVSSSNRQHQFDSLSQTKWTFCATHWSPIKIIPLHERTTIKTRSENGQGSRERHYCILISWVFSIQWKMRYNCIRISLCNCCDFVDFHMFFFWFFLPCCCWWLSRNSMSNKSVSLCWTYNGFQS